MRRKVLIAALAVAAGALGLTVALTRGPSPDSSTAASHREAPLISQDPTVDVTDLYAFVSPDKPDTVTLIADWIPFEEPSAGPNWYGFSENARYEIKIDNTGDARADITYRFEFSDTANSNSSALPLGCIASPCQTYKLTQIKNGDRTVLGNFPVAPNNIGPRTFPNGYASVRNDTVKPIPGGGLVFAGPAEDPFFGDIAAAFDLVGIRSGTGNKGGGKDSFAGFNVHTTALQIPKAELQGSLGDTIGVWAASYRPVTRVVAGNANTVWRQVARLANPLVNELLIPTNRKDEWNGLPPAADSRFNTFVLNPILAPVLNQLYAQLNLNIPESNRTDLVQVFHTGVTGLNNTGPKIADMLRLNMSIAPSATENRLGVVGMDNAGWPNGRRLGDDVIDIAEIGLGGVLVGNNLPLGDGVNGNDVPYGTSFPYVAQPNQGFANSHGVLQPVTP
jgi:Domain of unknown function (DUF4331)